MDGNTQWTVGSTSYDANGNVLTSTDARNVTTTSTYDALNRPSTRAYSDGTPTVSYFYDGTGLPQVPQFSKGKLTKITTSISETRYTQFDNLGRLLESQQITDGQTYVSSFQYNLSGALVQETYPSGRVTNNTLDNIGNVSRIYGKRNAAETERTFADSFTYTPDNKIKQLRLGSGLWETAQFNSRLQVTEFDLGQTAGASDVWKANYDYGELNTDGTVNTLKNTGNITKQTINFTGLANPLVQAYKYDSLDRLTEAKETSGATQTWVQNWTYDRYGNRTGFTQNIGGMQNNTTPSVDVNTNRFVSNQGFVYDKNGNVINDAASGGRQFIFDGNNKQTEVKDSNGTTIGRYYYDGDGKRIKKVTNQETTVFVYSNGKLAEEYSNQTVQTGYIYAGAQLLATETATDTNYTATDQLGSPRVITNSVGGVVSRRDFLPFGEEIFADGQIRTTGNKYSLTGQDAVRQRFTGYQRDLETGLDFAEARYYNNQHGRFTAVDPLLASGKSANPQTFNRYVYAMNRPLILTDTTGMQAGKKAPPERYSGAIFINKAGTQLSTAQSDEFPTQLQGSIYATRGKKTYLANADGYVEVGIPPNTDPQLWDMAKTMALARKMIGGIIKDAVKAESLGIDMSDPGSQMALIEATGGFAMPAIMEEEGGAELGNLIAGETETYYRTMTPEAAASLEGSGILTAGSETFVTQTLSEAQRYNGVTMKMEVNSGTTEELANIGVRNAAANHPYPSMPLVSKGWKDSNAFFKMENDTLNVGLGNGEALNTFNCNIVTSCRVK